MFQGGPIKLFFEFRGLFLGLENFFFLFAQIHALKIWWKILVCYQIPWHRHAGSEVGKNVSSNNFKQCDTNRKFRLKILCNKMLSDFKNISDPFHFCPAWSSLKIFLKSKMFLQNKIFSQSKKKFFLEISIGLLSQCVKGKQSITKLILFRTYYPVNDMIC